MAQDKDEDEIHFQFGRLWQLYVPLPPGVVWWQAEWCLALRGNAPYSEVPPCIGNIRFPDLTSSKVQVSKVLYKKYIKCLALGIT